MVIAWENETLAVMEWDYRPEQTVRCALGEAVFQRRDETGTPEQTAGWE